jgi:hypothetical protein
MKKLVLFFISVALVISATAADKGASKNSVAVPASVSAAAVTTVVSGKITDKLSGEALAGVEVQLLDTNLKAYTDFDGNFEFKNVTPGAHAVKVGLISYQELVKNVYAANNSKPVQIKLESVKK